MRWMWLANEAMITRPRACEMILRSSLPTSASEGVKLGFWAFVAVSYTHLSAGWIGEAGKLVCGWPGG